MKNDSCDFFWEIFAALSFAIQWGEHGSRLPALSLSHTLKLNSKADKWGLRDGKKVSEPLRFFTRGKEIAGPRLSDDDVNSVKKCK